MWEIVYSGRFKKDVKRYKNQEDKIEALHNVLLQLQENGMVDDEYHPHALIGNYKGLLECHIQNDFLLIWSDESEHKICLIRLGSHSELFK